MKRVIIRLMTPDEIVQVAEVWRRSRIDAVPALEARLGHSFEEDLEHFAQVVVPGNSVWVAELDGMIVGMMAVQGSDLEKLYIEPRHQRRGIGTLLLEQAKHGSPSGLSLFTHQINTRARAFYEANGFRATKFGVSPPPENEPDVCYVWTPRRPESAA